MLRLLEVEVARERKNTPKSNCTCKGADTTIGE